MFSDVVAEGKRERLKGRYEKDRWEESRKERKTMGRYDGRNGTGKLEIFIVASFPFYAESRDRSWFHSTHLNAIRHRDVIIDTLNDTIWWKVTIADRVGAF